MNVNRLSLRLTRNFLSFLTSISIITDELRHKGESVKADYQVSKPDMSQESTTDFLQFLVDPSMSNLFTFFFDQKEVVPFPVEVNLTDDKNINRSFSVQFKYNPEGPCQEGYLEPVSAKDKLDIASHKMNSQDKTIADRQMALKNTLVIDPEMQESILTDAQNLSSEIIDLIKSLEVFAFPNEEIFSMEEYSQFLLNRNLQVYLENLRLLGNKIHGLKGSCCFCYNLRKPFVTISKI